MLLPTPGPEPMNPDETTRLAELLSKTPGFRGIDVKDVRRLVELLRESPEIGSIEVKGLFGTGVVVTRTLSGAHADARVPDGHADARTGRTGRRRRFLRAAPAAVLKEIKSPMVGTYYASPEPGAEPYLRVGQRVTTGQTVCIIEAMKIMNEIEAEFARRHTEVCVEDATPVEYGQVLFRVDPNG